jgi:tRNA threonylcarbamoyl adenosine modification protein YjeE
MNEINFICNDNICCFICDEKAACLLAKLLAKSAKAGDCFALHGDLGTGKSTFARAFIQELCGSDTFVASPTFTISQSYETMLGQTLWHYDLYRIESKEELFEIGLEETISCTINLIEWPEIAKSILPPQTINISFAFSEKSDYRHINIE